MNSYLQKLAADMTRPGALLVSLLMALAFSARFYQAHRFLYLLLAFRFWVMSVFLSNRLPANKPVLLHQRVIAYISKCVPFFYHASMPLGAPILHAVSDALGLAGSLLSTWAILGLGRRFGIAPAKRGEVCRSGAYRWFRHPIYIGYAMVEFGATLLSRTNIPIFVISMSALAIRAQMEDKILQAAV